MNESYAEWLVKQKTSPLAYLARGLMIVILLISIVMSVSPFFGVLGVIALTLAAAGTYFVFRNTGIEYEYLYVSGQLSVDKIMGKAARKKVCDIPMEDIQIIAPLGADQLKEYGHSTGKTLDFTSHQPGSKVYQAVYTQSGQTVRMNFEPNDKMLTCFRQTAPRKIVQ